MFVLHDSMAQSSLQSRTYICNVDWTTEGWLIIPWKFGTGLIVPFDFGGTTVYHADENVEQARL